MRRDLVGMLHGVYRSTKFDGWKSLTLLRYHKISVEDQSLFGTGVGRNWLDLLLDMMVENWTLWVGFMLIICGGVGNFLPPLWCSFFFWFSFCFWLLWGCVFLGVDLLWLRGGIGPRWISVDMDGWLLISGFMAWGWQICFFFPRGNSVVVIVIQVSTEFTQFGTDEVVLLVFNIFLEGR